MPLFDGRSCIAFCTALIQHVCTCPCNLHGTYCGILFDCSLLQVSQLRACIKSRSVCTRESQPMKARSIVRNTITISSECTLGYAPAFLPSKAVISLFCKGSSRVVMGTLQRPQPPIVDASTHLVKPVWCRHKHQDNMSLVDSRRIIMACRFQGPFKVEALQQFVADRLLKLPQVAAVKPQSLDKFLARVAQHKVTALAFSSSSKASLPLRHAAQQHERYVVVGRVHWKAEVRLGFCLSCCDCMYFGSCHGWRACCAAEITLAGDGGEGAGVGVRGSFRAGRPCLVVVHV